MMQMMAIDNPVLNLKTLNDLESRFTNYQITPKDLEEIDFFISSIGGNQNFIKNVVRQNGLDNFHQYILERNNRNSDRTISLGAINGTVMGAISFLKNYVIK